MKKNNIMMNNQCLLICVYFFTLHFVDCIAMEAANNDNPNKIGLDGYLGTSALKNNNGILVNKNEGPEKTITTIGDLSKYISPSLNLKTLAHNILCSNRITHTPGPSNVSDHTQPPPLNSPSLSKKIQQKSLIILYFFASIDQNSNTPIDSHSIIELRNISLLIAERKKIFWAAAGMASIISASLFWFQHTGLWKSKIAAAIFLSMWSGYAYHYYKQYMHLIGKLGDTNIITYEQLNINLNSISSKNNN